ncbi:uncharacterized protein PG986_002842 [Apiospora aurea]|uniref:Secreted protein n=1 Tax=Apiospora aurea TaxID=335848 RepID=A0ABR1QPZ4_9PEZI
MKLILLYKVYLNPLFSSSVVSCMPASMAAFSSVRPARSRRRFSLHMYASNATTENSLTAYPTSMAM